MSLTTPIQRAIHAAVLARAVNDGVPAIDLLDDYVTLADPQDLAAVRAQLDTAGPRFLIWSYERMAWWAPRRHGYTANPHAAGRYPIDQATRIIADANCWMPACAIPNAVMVLAPECWVDRLDVPDPLAWRLAVATAELMISRDFVGWDLP